MVLKKVYKEGQMKKEGVKNVTITVENVKQGIQSYYCSIQCTFD